jgi:NADH-quinone oxidoreductase subunit L
MADKWFVDGILAKLTAAVTGFVGTVLRAFQTGRVQAYSASMVIGLAGLAWFMLRPHAAIEVDDRNLKQTGQVTLKAAPGLGYTYRWEAKDVQTPADFTPTGELEVRVGPGEKREVKLFVRNAFGQETSETVAIERPGTKRAGADPGNLPVPTRRPTMPTGTSIPVERIPDMLPGGNQ